MTISPTTWQDLEITGSVHRSQLNNAHGAVLFSGATTPNRANQILGFTSGSPQTNGLAWRYESFPAVHELSPTSPFDSALFGFIQTVEYFAAMAEYRDGSKVYFGAERARDSATVSIPAPWFNREGSPTGPLTAPNFATAGHPLLIEDAPQARFHAFRNGNPLRRVALEGVFGIRLIAHDPGLNLSLTTIAILFHARIRLALRFEQNGMDSPTMPLSWRPHGRTTVLSEGPGRGPGPIVLLNPLARRQLARPAATDTRRRFSEPFGSTR